MEKKDWETFQEPEGWENTDDEKTVAPWMLPEEGQQRAEGWENTDDEKTVAPWMLPEEGQQRAEGWENTDDEKTAAPWMTPQNVFDRRSSWDQQNSTENWEQPQGMPGWDQQNSTENWEQPQGTASWEQRSASPFENSVVSRDGNRSFENPLRQRGSMSTDKKPVMTPPPRKSHKVRNTLLGVCGLLVAAGIAGGTFYFFHERSETSEPVDADEVVISEIQLPLSGNVGTLEWEIQGSLEEGYTLSIGGRGMLVADNSEDTIESMEIWKEVGGSITSLEIAEGVSGIFMDNAFQDFSALTEVSLPTSLEWIGSGVFSHCTHLEHIILPKNLQGISTRAFYHCISLQEINIPEQVSLISTDAFKDCGKLSAVTFEGKKSDIIIASGNGDLR